MRHRMRDLFKFEAPEDGGGTPPAAAGVTQEEESDVNTQEGFDKALAAKFGRDLPEGYNPSPSTAITDGLDFGQPRDPQTGQFLPKAPEGPAVTAPYDQEAPPPPAAPAETPPPAAPETTPADELAALRKQVEDAQSFIGRQAEELGQLRQAVQQQPVQLPAAPIPYVDQEQAEQIYAWVENAGFKNAMLWTIQNNPGLHDVVLQAGRDMDNPEAREYEINLRVQEALMAQQAQAPQAQQGADPFVAQLKQQDAMKTVVTKIKADTPDFADLQPHVTKALEEQPLLAELVTSGDPQRMEQGLRLAAGVARGYAATELAAAAAAQAGAAAGQREAVKQAAQVATGSARVGTSGQASGTAPTEQEREAAIAEFKKAIMDAPGTSVADGLTFG